MKYFRFVLILQILFLTACAAKPRASISEQHWQQRYQQLSVVNQWTVKGRLGVTTSEQKESSNFSWQHRADNQELKLYGSLGITYAELSTSKGIATLKLSDNEVYQSASATDLIHKTLGYPLPIEQLQYWILGLSSPGDDNHLIFDNLGYLSKIKYQKWTINYQKYKVFPSFTNHYFPSKITITDGDMTLKLIIRNWSKEADL